MVMSFASLKKPAEGCGGSVADLGEQRDLLGFGKSVEARAVIVPGRDRSDGPSRA